MVGIHEVGLDDVSLVLPYLYSIVVLLAPPLVGVACIIDAIKVDEHQIRLAFHNEPLHVLKLSR